MSDFSLVVNQYLTNKVSVIIEAAFHHRVWEPKMPEIASVGRPFLIVCSIDAELAARRHLQGTDTRIAHSITETNASTSTANWRDLTSWRLRVTHLIFLLRTFQQKDILPIVDGIARQIHASDGFKERVGLPLTST